MRNSIVTTVLLLCISLAGCAPHPNSKYANQTDNGTKSTALKTYRFKSEASQCDTYERTFATQQELCYAIQLDELNNECAATERRAYFDENCTALTKFDPITARKALMNVNGKYVDCTYSETNLPEIRQFTANRELYMSHTKTRAKVWHDIKDMKVVLGMYLYDASTGEQLKKVERFFQDESETVVLTAPLATGNAVLTCLVNLADNPNRN